MGLGQVRTLNQNLGAIFGVIASGTSQTNYQLPGDIVVGAGKIPCATCPAAMTRFEAGLYCSSQNKRLPTDVDGSLQRGVDGRVYPWGNQFDDRRANVPGLPQKGKPPPTLKPVDAYPGEVDPFGLVDTVGNAGGRGYK